MGTEEPLACNDRRLAGQAKSKNGHACNPARENGPREMANRTHCSSTWFLGPLCFAGTVNTALRTGYQDAASVLIESNVRKTHPDSKAPCLAGAEDATKQNVPPLLRLQPRLYISRGSLLGVFQHVHPNGQPTSSRGVWHITESCAQNCDQRVPFRLAVAVWIRKESQQLYMNTMLRHEGHLAHQCRRDSPPRASGGSGWAHRVPERLVLFPPHAAIGQHETVKPRSVTCGELSPLALPSCSLRVACQSHSPRSRVFGSRTRTWHVRELRGCGSFITILAAGGVLSACLEGRGPKGPGQGGRGREHDTPEAVAYITPPDFVPPMAITNQPTNPKSTIVTPQRHPPITLSTQILSREKTHQLGTQVGSRRERKESEPEKRSRQRSWVDRSEPPTTHLSEHGTVRTKGGPAHVEGVRHGIAPPAPLHSPRPGFACPRALRCSKRIGPVSSSPRWRFRPTTALQRPPLARTHTGRPRCTHSVRFAAPHATTVSRHLRPLDRAHGWRAGLQGRLLSTRARMTLPSHPPRLSPLFPWSFGYCCAICTETRNMLAHPRAYSPRTHAYLVAASSMDVVVVTPHENYIDPANEGILAGRPVILCQFEWSTGSASLRLRKCQ